MMYYYRYHYSIMINGIRIKVNVNANNQISAYQKVKRLYPMAEKIHLTRSEKINQY